MWDCEVRKKGRKIKVGRGGEERGREGEEMEEREKGIRNRTLSSFLQLLSLSSPDLSPSPLPLFLSSPCPLPILSSSPLRLLSFSPPYTLLISPLLPSLSFSPPLLPSLYSPHLSPSPLPLFLSSPSPQ